MNKKNIREIYLGQKQKRNIRTWIRLGNMNTMNIYIYESYVRCTYNIIMIIIYMTAWHENIAGFDIPYSVFLCAHCQQHGMAEWSLHTRIYDGQRPQTNTRTKYRCTLFFLFFYYFYYFLFLVRFISTTTIYYLVTVCRGVTLHNRNKAVAASQINKEKRKKKYPHDDQTRRDCSMGFFFLVRLKCRAVAKISR